MTRLAAWVAGAVVALTGLGHAQDAKALRVYFADVEGGQATLFVTPEGDSMLVDTGWPGFNGRDADRIAALCHKAGVTKIGTVVVTHFHVDHVGGLPQLTAKIPVERFVDHGVNREQDGDVTEAGWKAYQKVLADGHYAHATVKPGDEIPVKGLRVQVVSGDGELIQKPLKGAGETNPACARSAERPLEVSENDRSLGMMITFGKLRILDLGDLTWAMERPLMCPVNKLGKVDVYIVSHHGMARSGSPALVDAVAPRVAVMDNGGTKGASPEAWEVVKHSPRLEDLWQLHTAEANDAAHNVTDTHIANLAATRPDAGNYLELTGRLDGAFSVTNSRTEQTMQYPAK